MKNRENYYMESDFIEAWPEMEPNIFQNNPKNLGSALSGYWYDIVNAGRYYLKEDSKGKVSFQEYSFLDGSWISTAEGVGTIKGKLLTVPYTTSSGKGIFKGRTDAHGQTIQGKALNHSTGKTVELYLNRE
jgi:hypothetical protein